MIYLVSTCKELFKSDLYKIISPEKAINLLNTQSLLGADTETMGMSPFTKQLLSVQLGTEEFQIVWDCTTVDVQLLKPILENPNIKTIWWNYSFDGKFLYHQRIVPNNIYDGMLAEQLLWLGYPKGYHSMSLQTAAKTYCGVDLDKSVRGQIITKGLTPAVIQYAAFDVRWEIEIYKKQMESIKRFDLEQALKIENEFVKVLAYIEYCGVKLDVDKWKEKMRADKEEELKWEKELNDWVVSYCIENHITDRYTKVDLQGDLFTGFDPNPKCILNWNSPKQIIPLFEELGFKLETFDKKTKQTKKSVESKIIGAQEDVSSIAKLYVKYKEASKVTSSFGQNFIDAIDSGDGRIHPSFFQLGTDTARLSSGGGEAGVNIQQLPHDEMTRSCFIADKGNSWISADYQSQESRLIASVSGDKAMIELFEHGCGDVHSLVAKMSYSKFIPQDLPVEKVKAFSKANVEKGGIDFRQEAKGIEFAINYGGDYNTISNNKGIPLKEAKEIYNSFMEGFPGIKNYQDWRRQDVFEKGYILMNPITRHKAFIPDMEELKETYQELQDPDVAQYIATYRRTLPDDPLIQRANKFNRRKSDIEKHSINYPIQNSGAMCFKLSSILLFKWLQKNNLLFIVKYCIPVHDELNLECPKEMEQQIADILVKCMVAGGKPFCDKVFLGADVNINKHWVH